MKLYVIYDRVAEESGPVFEAINDGIANRAYKAFLAKQTHAWFDETDYALICVGELDKKTNILISEPPREVYISLSLIDEEKDAESL
jgi:hypothetical protein